MVSKGIRVLLIIYKNVTFTIDTIDIFFKLLNRKRYYFENYNTILLNNYKLRNHFDNLRKFEWMIYYISSWLAMYYIASFTLGTSFQLLPNFWHVNLIQLVFFSYYTTFIYIIKHFKNLLSIFTALKFLTIIYTCIVL